MLAGNLDLPQDISQIYKSLSEYVFHFHWNRWFLIILYWKVHCTFCPWWLAKGGK
jgi:hypothetical protein